MGQMGTSLLSIKMVLPLQGHSFGSFLREQNNLLKSLKLKCSVLVISQILLAVFFLWENELHMQYNEPVCFLFPEFLQSTT